jgi:isocitrate/isopropylmalate dehydrogenase
VIKIAVLPGDGIGREVTQAALPVFKALDVPVNVIMGDIGWSYWQKEGNPIPQRTWRLIDQVDAVLLGATTSKPYREAQEELCPALKNQEERDYLSPIIQLRQTLDLFANIRPCFNVRKEDKPFNFCIIRENTEGLYAGFDYHPLPPELKSLLQSNPKWQNSAEDEISCALRLQSKKGLKRIYEFAFQYAKKHQMHRVTLADKPNVLRASGAFAREQFEAVAKEFPSISADILNVDAVALGIIRRPESFGVIVAENMFGDILSDVGAGVMGGLGFAPSANIGQKGCYFEPVHGSGPAMLSAQANPSAMFLTIGLLLNYFGYTEQAKKIRQAVSRVVNENQHVTYDLNGSSTTAEMASAIIEKACDATYEPV